MSLRRYRDTWIRSHGMEARLTRAVVTFRLVGLRLTCAAGRLRVDSSPAPGHRKTKGPCTACILLPTRLLKRTASRPHAQARRLLCFACV